MQCAQPYNHLSVTNRHTKVILLDILEKIDVYLYIDK